MPSPREILVTTTSSVQGIEVKQYLKPVSAHVVTGINIFNDFFGGLTDFFGGRSGTYQRQIASIYNEAIDRIKYAAFQLGADGVLGLNIDIDEISGKNKSMLMITATGTAVVLDKPSIKTSQQTFTAKTDTVSSEKLDILRKKKKLLEQANQNMLDLNEDNWRFIISNSLDDFYPFIMSRYPDVLMSEQTSQQAASEFTKSLVSYIDSLPDQKKKELLYGSLTIESSDQIVSKILSFIKQFNLFDKEQIQSLFNNQNFSAQKRGALAVFSDKSVYNEEDLKDIDELINTVEQHFPERGQRTTKQGFLSSKEKAAWKCDCGKTNDMDTYCSSCHLDIYGFRKVEASPPQILSYLKEKKEMLQSLL